jgi:hypothetical protein
MAAEQYQTLRSVSDNHVHLICHDGRFGELPGLAPAHSQTMGLVPHEIGQLKPEYRLALALEGYALVKSELAVFKPEV